jgi:hypothetical protein
MLSWLESNWHVIITSTLSALATLGLSYRFFAERLVGHFFDRKLEAFKHESARDLEQFKHQQNQEIEKLRGAVGHLSDRGKHSNEREYAAVSVLWEKAVELYFATNTCVISYIEFPSLNAMPAEELVEFLNTTDFSEPQKKLVAEATDKERSFSHITGRRQINAALHQVYAMNEALHKQGIFVPLDLCASFDAFRTMCSKAIAQRRTEHGESFRTGLAHDIEFLTDGPSVLEALKTAVRNRLLRE